MAGRDARLAGRTAAEGAAFLAANKDKPGVVTTESGLQYQVLEEGEGAKPTAFSRKVYGREIPASTFCAFSIAAHGSEPRSDADADRFSEASASRSKADRSAAAKKGWETRRHEAHAH